MTVRVQYKAFDSGQLIDSLRANDPSVGAVVNFIGYVRDINAGQEVASLFLEHYPGMTERSLQKIIDNAKARWPLKAVQIVHRIGQLSVTDPVVFVGVSSQHRHAAFEACAFIMDYLKTDAPLWKREDTGVGARWVDARDSDRSAAERWANTPR
ncbi:molybdenum cofactor biosynthesis protein MoaE [Pseudomonas sp. Leaf48]|jgi:molybdopterin synthase catalytic subunit|uniref:molybdopterin synthase catalytic subunit MoaE n=1 Tax=unclassified Pseudomonas TaxID=196821 RepID=UPI0007279E9A|nr:MULTISPECIES: molybdopterin synthase catalytic subunit MoaE [unclassified Pseudomonas]KQN49107.1 molybdenum cofactor biosynthesis protein MoaE [Pseudomonas sp. Leaf48]MBV7477397.1 molybdopterin synthase catalytic subunit MoaE [Pseudomonas sp. PDM31]